MNLLREATLPINFYTSFTEMGPCILIRALILSGFAAMPVVETRHPRSFPLSMPKTHFSGFNLKFATLVRESFYQIAEVVFALNALDDYIVDIC
jgi:hypothetical protein